MYSSTVLAPTFRSRSARQRLLARGAARVGDEVAHAAVGAAFHPLGRNRKGMRLDVAADGRLCFVTLAPKDPEDRDHADDRREHQREQGEVIHPDALLSAA